MQLTVTVASPETATAAIALLNLYLAQAAPAALPLPGTAESAPDPRQAELALAMPVTTVRALPITVLGVSPHTHDQLKKARLDTLGAAADVPPEDFKRVYRFSGKMAKAVINALEKFDLEPV